MNILSQLLINFILLGSQIQQPDSDFIKLERIGGDGPPFEYSVTVYSTGTVEHTDTLSMLDAGRRLYKISKDSVAYLFRRVENIGFFSLKPKYIFGIKLRTNKNGSVDTFKVILKDLPIYTVTVKIGNRSKSVVDYFRSLHKELKAFEAPEELHNFENEIERITHP
jgi:hypothetical protein